MSEALKFKKFRPHIIQHCFDTESSEVISFGHVAVHVFQCMGVGSRLNVQVALEVQQGLWRVRNDIRILWSRSAEMPVPLGVDQ